MRNFFFKSAFDTINAKQNHKIVEDVTNTQEDQRAVKNDFKNIKAKVRFERVIIEEFRIIDGVRSPHIPNPI